MSEDERRHLEEMLQQHRQNLRFLEQQAAQFGAANLPLHLHNQIEGEKETITYIKTRLDAATASPISSALSTLSSQPSRRSVTTSDLPQENINTTFEVVEGKATS